MGWVLSRATARVEKVATPSSENYRAQSKDGHARSGAEETLRSDTNLGLTGFIIGKRAGLEELTGHVEVAHLNPSQVVSG